jgi:hypothetical protein
MPLSILPIVIPGIYGTDGPILDISTLAGEKTILLDGSFDGQYILYGSHDNANFVPIFSFSGARPQSIRQIFESSYLSVRMHSLASNAIGVTASVSGNFAASANSFAPFPIVALGSYGPQPVVDLFGLIPPSGLLSGTNIILNGPFIGTISVEGSLDGVKFSPVGSFKNSSKSSLNNGLQSSVPENGPLAYTQQVRYLRLNVLDGCFVLGNLFATVGGETDPSGTSTVTLEQAYEDGSVAADQTLPLADAKGGGVIIDGHYAVFTGTYSLQVVAPSGGLFAFPRTGGFLVASSKLVASVAGAVWNEVDLQASTVTLTGAPGAVTSLAMSHVGSGVIDGAGNTVGDAYNQLIDLSPAGTATITRSWSLGASGAIQAKSGLVMGPSLNPPGENDIVFGAGATVVSQANSGRIGYIAGVSQQFYASLNTGAYVPILVGPAAAGFTQGSILFGGATGQPIQDNANFIWDNTNKRLGIDVASTPTARLHVAGVTTIAGTASLKIDAGTLLAATELGAIESDGTHLYWTSGGNVRIQLDNAAVTTTLAQAYNNGAAASDQTFVLLDAKGGGIVVNATDPVNFTGAVAFEIDVVGGSTNFYRKGGFDVSSAFSVAAAGGANWNEVAFLASTVTLTGAPTTVNKLAMVSVGTPTINGAGITVSDAYNLLLDAAPGGTSTLTRSWSLGVVGAVQFQSGLVLGASVDPHNENNIVFGSGATVVSQANTGRLGYRSGASQQFYVSMNTGAYVPLLTGPAVGGFTQGSVPFGSTTGQLAEDNPNFFWDNTNKRLGIGTFPTSTLHVVQQALNALAPTAFTVVGGAHTAITTSAEDIGANFNFSASKQWATGALATQREVLIQAPTYTFVGASTITSAATLAISGAPIAGANATLTNSYALWTQSGSVQHDGGTYVATSGAQKLIGATATFAPTSGTATFQALNLTYTVNQTGGANGDVTGLLVNEIDVSIGNVANLMDLQRSGVSRFAVARNANVTVTQFAGSNPGTLLSLTSATASAIAATSESITANFNFSATKTWATGAIATQREILFQAPTYAFAGASTITTAASVAITGSPLSGANATIENALALWTQTGRSMFGTQIDLFMLHTTSSDMVVFGNNNTFTLALIDNNTGGPSVGSGGSLLFGGRVDIGGSAALSPTKFSYILGAKDVATNVYGGTLQFFTIASTSFAVEGMRIDSNQTVGIGTPNAAPASSLRVSSANHFATSAAGAVWNGIDFVADGMNVTGNTAIVTATGFNAVSIAAASINGDTATCAITHSASLAILGAPTAGADVSITNAYALWVQSGLTRIDGGIKFGADQTVSATDVNVAGPYTVLATDYYLKVRRTTAAAISINLPAGVEGRVIPVKDSGYNASVNNITLVRNGADKINNVAGNYTMNISGECIWLRFNSTTTDWELC